MSDIVWDSPAPAGITWDETKKSAPENPNAAAIERARQMVSGTAFGAGYFAPDLLKGVLSGPQALAQMASSFSPSAKNAVGSVNQYIDSLYSKYANPEGTPGSGLAQVAGASLLPGAIAGKIAPAASALGRFGQGVGVGAAQGALTPLDQSNMDAKDFWAQKAAQAGTGAAVGAVTSPLAAVAGRVISPRPSAAAQELIDSNVSMTPGQRMGGIFKSAEDKATSIPIVGDLINWNRKGGLDDFNRAIYNKVLAPIGETYTGPIGQPALAEVAKKASAAYGNVLDRAVPAPAQDLVEPLNQIATMVPASLRQDFVDSMRSHVFSQMTPAGTLTPSVAKAADSELGRLARNYQSSSQGSERILSNAYQQAAKEVRILFRNANPDLATAMDAANSSWAQLVQLENAARGVKVARNEGVLTPYDYLKGINKSDSSVRDRVFSQGNMQNQAFAQAADKILPNKYPDSGTVGRLLLAGGGAGLGGMFPGMGLPAAAGIGAASIPYLPGFRGLLAMAMNKRPDMINSLGRGVSSAAPYLSAPVTSGLLDSQP